MTPMLAGWSRLVRWTLLLVIGFFALARPAEVRKAWAGGDDDDDDAASAGDDDDGGGGDDDDDAGGDDDATQPPVTAGGLYTKATYPISELQRPLTITGGMTEVRAGVNIDVSNANAFKQYGLAFDARHGFSDNLEGLVHVASDLNQFAAFDINAAVEGSISYDLVDFRIGFDVPVKKTTTVDPTTHESTSSTKAHFGIPFGFPFRYAPKPQVGIVALESFMTIDFDGSAPDFTPAVAIAVQPIPALALKLHANVNVANFDFSKDNLVIPVSVNVQYSPTNLLDFGGEFQFPNLKPATTMGVDPNDPTKMIDTTPKFYDNRHLLLYLQLRM
jgi:hypothetical protein